MATTQIPPKNSAFKPYNKSPTVESELSNKRDSSGCLKIEDRENGNDTREKPRNLENEKNKRQVIKNMDNNGNNTASEAPLSIGSLSSLSSSSSSTLSPYSIQAQNLMSSPILSSTILSNTVAPRGEEFLFEKMLYQSDVNNLNRLIIPRKFAETYFPCLKISKYNYKKENLVFLDHQNIAWNMIFEFWESSRSYVLTKGWRAFVNQYQLRPNFMVRFYQPNKYLAKKHYGIEYVVRVPIKTIRLFGQDCHYLCLDEINGGGGGYGNNGDNASSSNSSSGQNKIIGQGQAEGAAMEKGKGL
ncbi:B3 domain-containing protein Os04g0581400-like [Macadamia integrifolia]|uniref:B3 domain-containing protein Os04g0581400-like n=1 Tax=Macadamia integrifolia TaxID=60698 RepID=UPI001C4F82F5|nr:B3 domain-containing protein Os04g0581400-like [Macadamia integrifolia]